MLIRTQALLAENAAARNGIAAKYRAIMVDEFQDTDPPCRPPSYPIFSRPQERSVRSSWSVTRSSRSISLETPM
ncbi:UvrD-helicase domain-containing protein [Methanogenium cariaci]|uniref:UvrD-helicase domain-containing protein n=1 Tax=Methanogenium cariaci TaxID=2197 RepID=UPI00155DB629|nr:UvrD-helicase domain-containing protein [Methanogenium cariaci]